MTTLFDYPLLGDSGTQQGGILQSPGQDPPGIDLSAAPLAPPMPALSTPRQPAPVAPPVQTARQSAIGQMGGVQQFLSALGEFGAGMTGRPSPINTNIAQDQAVKAEKLRAGAERLQLVDSYVKISRTLRGDAKKQFDDSAVTDLNAASPGAGDMYANFAANPSLHDNLPTAYKFWPPWVQNQFTTDPDGFMKHFSSGDNAKMLETWNTTGLTNSAARKAADFMTTGQAPKTAVEFAAAQRVLPDGSKQKITPDEWAAINSSKETQDLFYHSQGMLSPHDEGAIGVKKREDLGKREVTEIGVGKDAKGNDLVQKAYIEGGQVVEKIGEPYIKSPALTLNQYGTPLSGVDTDPKSPTFGQPIYSMPSKTEPGKATTIRGIAPMSSAASVNEGLGAMAADALYFGKNPPQRDKVLYGKVMDLRAHQGHQLGLTDVEISQLPQDNKVKMKAVDKLTTWGAFIDKSSTQLDKTIDIAIDYAKKIDPGQLQFINKGIIAGVKQFNNPDANAYALQVNSIRQEYGRLMSGPTSNAMLPVEAMKKGDELISTGLDVPSWMEIKKSILRDAAAAQTSTHQTQESLRGSMTNFGQHGQPTLPITPTTPYMNLNKPNVPAKDMKPNFTKEEIDAEMKRRGLK